MTRLNEYDRQLTRDDVERGDHRLFVGGLWDEIGALQLAFLRAQGLESHMRLLDVGCGCLRGGLHFVRYLEPGHYYGMDGNESLLNAGYDTELPAHALKERVPRDNLIVEARFRASRFGVSFDMALAVSLFTHLSLNHIRVCLAELARCVRPGGRFFASFFECPEGEPIEEDRQHQPGGLVSCADRDPYHYRASDLQWACRGLPWTAEYVGDWGHPRAQRMMAYTRTPAP